MDAHEFTSAPGDPYCEVCQLPAENARHRGEFTVTITVNGNDLNLVREEVGLLTAYFYEGDNTDEVWLTTGNVEHHSE